MTLVLSLGTLPRNLKVKTWGFIPQIVHIGGSEVPFKDFFVAVQHVLTGPISGPDDPRIPFRIGVGTMQQVDGYMKGRKRLEFQRTPWTVGQHLCGQVVHSRDFPPESTGWEEDYEFSLEDFLQAAYYVLTNTDLEPNDVRLEFVEGVKNP